RRKESDLVVTGDSATKYSLNGFTIDTQAQVFQSAAMVETDWKRQRPSELVKCFHDHWATQGPKGTTFVSGRTLSPPHLATHLVALQVVFSVSRGAGKQRVHVVMDMVVFARGRTEVMLAAAAPEAKLPLRT